MKLSILIFILAAVAQSSKFTLSLDSYEKQCFFEIMQANHKYTVEATPVSPGKYEVEVSNMLDGRWNSLLYRQSKTQTETISIHKLATIDSTYSFCFRNIDNIRTKYHIKIQSGLQLLQFQLLPDRSDAENLEREMGWLQQQKTKLFESLDKMQSLRASTSELTGLMSTKMVGFAIAGLIAIVVVNIVFYGQLKKSFKDRKLI